MVAWPPQIRDELPAPTFRRGNGSVEAYRHVFDFAASPNVLHSGSVPSLRMVR
jgi:hypothetical protein